MHLRVNRCGARRLASQLAALPSPLTWTRFESAHLNSTIMRSKGSDGSYSPGAKPLATSASRDTGKPSRSSGKATDPRVTASGLPGPEAAAPPLAAARAALGADWPAPRANMAAGVDFLRTAMGLTPLESPAPLAQQQYNYWQQQLAELTHGSGTVQAAAKEGKGGAPGGFPEGGGVDTAGPRRLVVVPDKDVDGLSAGAILTRTLRMMQQQQQQQHNPPSTASGGGTGVGGPEAPNMEVCVVHIGKGENVHQPEVAARLAALRPSALVLLDMGSRGGPAVLPGVPTLIIDHHQPQPPREGKGVGPVGEEGGSSSGDGDGGGLGAEAEVEVEVEEGGGDAGLQGGGVDGQGAGEEVGARALPGADCFPDGATVVSAFGCPPVAASALLCWCLCQQLHPPAAGPTAWLAVLGTLGDLGEGGLAGFGLEVLNRAHTEGRKTHFKEAVALLNAARRSPDCDVSSAWEALCAATCPADIAKPAAAGGGGGGGRRAVQVPGVGGLVAAREGLKAEMEAVGRTAPRFNADRSLALLPISSGWQVHPLLPNRWAYRLAKQDTKRQLKAVLCSNRGYLPGRVHFSARRAHSGDASLDLIVLLRGAVSERCRHPALAGTPLAALPARLGDDFARGHPEATGGMVATEDFAHLALVLGFPADVVCAAVGEPAPPKKRSDGGGGGGGGGSKAASRSAPAPAAATSSEGEDEQQDTLYSMYREYERLALAVGEVLGVAAQSAGVVAERGGGGSGGAGAKRRKSSSGADKGSGDAKQRKVTAFFGPPVKKE